MIHTIATVLFLACYALSVAGGIYFYHRWLRAVEALKQAVALRDRAIEQADALAHTAERALRAARGYRAPVSVFVSGGSC